MKIYISGPITGKTRPELISSFGIIQNRLTDAGHSVVNPVDISHWGLSWETYMRIAISILESKEVDALIMLKGWMDSRGSVIERQWAITHGIPILYQDPRDKARVLT